MKISRQPAGLVLCLLCALAAAPAPAAGPVYWDWPEQVGFEKLELDGVAFDAHGRLMPGLAQTLAAAGEAEIVWDLAAAPDGSVYAATGNGGEVWRLDADGEAEVVARLSQAELFAIVVAGGAVFAGGGPDGLLLRVEPGAEPRTVADLPESYIWDAAAGPGGRLYLAVGSPAAVYEISAGGEPRKLATLPAANALCLAVAADGTLLVGTAKPGLICRIDPARPGRLEVLHEAEEAEVRRLAPGPDGAWYALASGIRAEDAGEAAALPAMPKPNGGVRLQTGAVPGSVVYRVEDDGLVTLFWSGAPRLAAIGHDESRGWLALTAAPADSGGALLGLEPPRGTRRLATWPAGEGVALLLPASAQGAIIAGLAHPAGLLRLQDRLDRPGSASSEPLDAGMAIRWGRLRWQGEQPRGSEVRWQVRGGPRSVPDSTWTAWSEAWSEPDHPLDLPPVRFLQWRVTLAGGEPGARVAAVSVSGRQPNRPPQIETFDLLPEGGLERGGLMSRQDNLTETLPGGLQLEYSATSVQDPRAGLLEAARVRPVRTFTWGATDPNGDRLAFRLEYRQPGRQAWRPIGDWSRELVGSWNTAAVPDGIYSVRLVASDDPDNPGEDALSTSRLLPAVVVDHTGPVIEDFALEPAPGGFRVGFRATDATSPLHRAQVELPDGRIERLDPVDGIADSQAERYERLVRFPAAPGEGPPPPWLVRVVVSDRPGNAVLAEGELAGPGEAASGGEGASGQPRERQRPPRRGR